MLSKFPLESVLLCTSRIRGQFGPPHVQTLLKKLCGTGDWHVKLFNNKLIIKLFGQKKCQKCLHVSVRNFKRPKILWYNKTTLLSRNKPDVIRKGLEMIGIVEAVTKELEPDDRFKMIVVDY